MNLKDKQDKLRQLLLGYQQVAIGFSGGVDSTLLVQVALDTLGKESVLAVVADSPTLPRREFNGALSAAHAMRFQCVAVRTEELDNESYASNPADRCYICKLHFFKLIVDLAQERGISHVLDGHNLDDNQDYRPGQRASLELGIKSPLMEAGLTKADVRTWSRNLGLPTADKPAYACLATRVPYGTPLTRKLLSQIEQAEEVLHELGLPECRVRHHQSVARIEVPLCDLVKLSTEPLRTKVVQGLHSAGYHHVALDLNGLQHGSLNKDLQPENERQV